MWVGSAQPVEGWNRTKWWRSGQRANLFFLLELGHPPSPLTSTLMVFEPSNSDWTVTSFSVSPCYRETMELPSLHIHTDQCLPKKKKNPLWYISVYILSGFWGGVSGKEPTCQCRRCKRLRFNPWVRKIPWRRVRQPTKVFLPGKFYGQRSLVGYSPWGHKESDTTESDLAHSMHTSCWFSFSRKPWLIQVLG